MQPVAHDRKGDRLVEAEWHDNQQARDEHLPEDGGRDRVTHAGGHLGEPVVFAMNRLDLREAQRQRCHCGDEERADVS